MMNQLPAQNKKTMFNSRNKSEAKTWIAKPWPDSYTNSVRALHAEENFYAEPKRRNLLLDKINPAHREYREVNK